MTHPGVPLPEDEGGANHAGDDGTGAAPSAQTNQGKRRTELLTSWLPAVVAGLAVVGIGVYLAIALTRPGLRLIVPAPARAGGLVRLYSAGNSAALRGELATLKVEVGAGATSVTAAVYVTPMGAEPRVGGPTVVIYLGVNTTSAVTLPSDPLTAMGLAGRVVSHARHVPPGPGGGSAVCFHIMNTRHYSACAWVSDQSLGIVLTPAKNQDLGRLADLMRRMRPDLQTG